jgi:multiple sugar transport system permease protein
LPPAEATAAEPAPERTVEPAAERTVEPAAERTVEPAAERTVEPGAAGPVPAEAGAAVLTRPGPSGDVVGLGRWRALGFVAPALVLIGVFLVFPALWTLYIGVTNYRLTGVEARAPEFVGLDNYRRALSDPTFYRSMRLTLIFVLASAVLGQNVLGFALAYASRSARRAVRRAVEALVLLAWILPSSVVAFLWIAMLDRDEGTVNVLLRQTPGVAWLVAYPMTCIIVFNIWRGAAFSMLLYSAALSSVPPSHLETARLAGSSAAQTLRDVVFPHIRRYALTNTLLITLWTFNDFTPFLITAGGPNGRSEIVAAYIYNTAIVGGDMGYSGAISLLVLLINLLLALVYLRVARVSGRRA